MLLNQLLTAPTRAITCYYFTGMYCEQLAAQQRPFVQAPDHSSWQREGTKVLKSCTERIFQKEKSAMQCAASFLVLYPLLALPSSHSISGGGGVFYKSCFSESINKVLFTGFIFVLFSFFSIIVIT